MCCRVGALRTHTRRCVQVTNADQWTLRVEPAAALRLAAKFGWHESVANHFSAAVSGDGKQLLLNPRWQHFASLRARVAAPRADAAATMRQIRAPGVFMGICTNASLMRAYCCIVVRLTLPRWRHLPTPLSISFVRTRYAFSIALQSMRALPALQTMMRKGNGSLRALAIGM